MIANVRKAEPGGRVYRPHRSSKGPDLFLFSEQYKDEAAFDCHRKAPHLVAFRELREKAGLTEGAAEVEFDRVASAEVESGRLRRAKTAAGAGGGAALPCRVSAARAAP